jgi:hypothetical protein
MSRHEIPYRKPGGKKAFFDRRDLDAYLQRNLIKSVEQLADEAEEDLRRRKLKRGG